MGKLVRYQLRVVQINKFVTLHIVMGVGLIRLYLLRCTVNDHWVLLYRGWFSFGVGAGNNISWSSCLQMSPYSSNSLELVPGVVVSKCLHVAPIVWNWFLERVFPNVSKISWSSCLQIVWN